MGETFISFRDFLTEISSSILSANEWLQSYQSGCFAPHEQAPQEFFPQCAPLKIKKVLLSFSAQAVHKAVPTAAADAEDTLFLSFAGTARKQPANLQAKILFTGDGEALGAPGAHLAAYTDSSC